MYGATQKEGDGLQVIGAGYGRTGTDSLKVALNELGYNTYHMYECSVHGDHQKWIDADTELKEEGGDRQKGQQILKSIFDDRKYTACVDFPASLYYDALFKLNPNAKVVLTVRDSDKWYDSCIRTFWNPNGYQFSWIIGMTDKGKMLQKMQRHVSARALGIPLADVDTKKREYIDNKEHCMAKFNEHNKEVRASIPSENLLVYKVGDGWEPLCEFLGKPVPDTPFPNVNDKEHFTTELQKAKVTILAIYSVIYSVLIAMALALAYGLKIFVTRVIL